MENKRKGIVGLVFILVLLIIVGDLIAGLGASHQIPIVQTGTNSCSINNIHVSCTKNITFNPPYSSTPYALPPTITSSPQSLTQFQTQTGSIFSQAYLHNAISFDISAQHPDSDIDPTGVGTGTFTISVTPSQVNEFAVLNVFMVDEGGCSILPDVVNTPTDTHLTVWNNLIPLTFDGNVNQFGCYTMFGALLLTNMAYVITITVSDLGPHVFAGATVELFQNVQSPHNAGVVSGNGLTSTATSISYFTTDYFVSGAELTVFNSGTCDSITSGTAGTTIRQTDSNCAANKVVNFVGADVVAGENQQIIYNFAKADGDVVGVVALEPTSVFGASSEWSCSSTTGQQFCFIYNANTNYAFVNLPSSSGTLTEQYHFQCFNFGSETTSVLFFVSLYLSSTVSPNISGTSAAICNGQDQSITIPVPFGGEMQIEGGCLPLNSCNFLIFPTESYITTIASYNLVPYASVTAISSSSMTVTISVNTEPSISITINFSWRTSLP